MQAHELVVLEFEASDAPGQQIDVIVSNSYRYKFNQFIMWAYLIKGEGFKRWHFGHERKIDRRQNGNFHIGNWG